MLFVGEAGMIGHMQGEVYTCKNGLTAIVSEQRAFPIVSVQVWVATGSESEGAHCGAGISHLLDRKSVV